jgi:hypothetical protein
MNAAPGGRSLGFALETFKRSHPDYVVDESHVPGYVLYPRASACVDALEKRVTVRLRGAANVALHQLARAVNPSVPHAPPGGVFAGSVQVDRSEEELFRQAVDVALQEVSLKEALLAVSRAAPGIVWVVRERPDKNHGRPACMLGLTTGHLEIVTSYRINP